MSSIIVANENSSGSAPPMMMLNMRQRALGQPAWHVLRQGFVVVALLVLAYGVVKVGQCVPLPCRLLEQAVEADHSARTNGPDHVQAIGQRCLLVEAVQPIADDDMEIGVLAVILPVVKAAQDAVEQRPVRGKILAADLEPLVLVADGAGPASNAV